MNVTIRRCRRSLPLLVGLLAGASHATTYQYDDLGRLVRETYDSGVEVTYTYDAVGNRTSRTVVEPPPDPEIFEDGFETGDVSHWSAATP